MYLYSESSVTVKNNKKLCPRDVRITFASRIVHLKQKYGYLSQVISLVFEVGIFYENIGNTNDHKTNNKIMKFLYFEKTDSFLS